VPITLYNAFNTEELDKLPGIPESVFKVRVDYSVPSTIPYVGKYLAGLNVGATGKYVKNQDYTTTPVGTGFAAVTTAGKSFTTFDLDAKYKVSAKWSAFAVAKNITNQNITRQSAGWVSDGHSDTEVDKTQGRTLWIGAEYNF
jgi:outer membrane receptor for ferrienterochelin and colicin